MTTFFKFALLSLFAFGCAEALHRPSPTPPPPPPTPPSPPERKRRTSMSFQIDSDSPVRATAEEAARQWTAALGIPVTATEDGEIPIFFTDELSCPAPTNLPEGIRVGACAPDIGTPDARIEMPTDVPERWWLTNLLHEMGHHLRGLRPAPDGSPYEWLAGDHHDDPSGLMYGGRVPSTARITAKDVAFVCEHEMACQLPPPEDP